MTGCSRARPVVLAQSSAPPPLQRGSSRSSFFTLYKLTPQHSADSSTLTTTKMFAVLAAAALCAVASADMDQYGLPSPVPAAEYAPPGYAPAPLLAPYPLTEGGDVKPVTIPENSQLSVQDSRGQYSQGFSDKGTEVSEQGSLLSTNEGWEYVIAKKGSYAYTSPEGQRITVNWVADHNGFRVLN